MKTDFLIILLIFILMLCFTRYNLKKPMKCDVDKRTEFMEKCINKIDLIHEPEQVSATGVIKQCEKTSQNLYCTY